MMRDALAQQRQGLLAKIHIAKKDMGLTDDQYEAMLSGMKVKSAKELTIPQMEKLILYMKHYGWRPGKARKPKPVDAQIAALKDRVREASLEIAGGQDRLPGLIKKICGVDSLIWCKSVNKLERLLAVLGKIREEEYDKKRRD
jgi:phage gp16-like protein